MIPKITHFNRGTINANGCILFLGTKENRTWIQFLYIISMVVAITLETKRTLLSSTCEVGHCNRLEVRRCLFWYKCNNLDPPITYINSYPQINYLHIKQYENSFLTFSLMLLQKSNYLDKSVSFSWLRFLYLSPKTNPFSPIHTIRKLPKYYYFCFLAFYYMLSSIFEQKTYSRSVSGSLPHTIIAIETEAPHLLR